jgi:choline dehydrogenase
MSDMYDVIVVGAGSAGCALARHLSDDPEITVALLEAGGEDTDPDIATPSAYYRLWGSALDWDYHSAPQPGTAGRVHQLPRGRVLGGTSAINGMVYLRGPAADFDGWAVDGWGWDDVRAAYERLEALLRPAVVGERNELSEVFLDAAAEAGHPLRTSFDDGALEGCGWNRSSIHEGRRHSSYRAFVHPVRDRPNLAVLTDTTVERLRIDGGGTVTGVEVVRDGRRETLLAGEVVLAAGAYDSPRLLLKSGIGPAAHLAERGIDAVVDLPVGENLQDHLLVGVVYDSGRPIDPLNAHITESCAFARSSLESTSADIEISFNKEPHFAPPAEDGRHRFTIIPGVTKLRSRGTVRLADGGPQRLAIDHNYFADPRDMAMMIEAVRASRAIGETAALGEWATGEHFPGPGVESDAEIAGYVAAHVSTWFHPAGTCRMGGGEHAVVDAQLRVLGTEGLRVADASIMPTVVSVNTNAASTMVGWRAAELIRGE